MAIACPSMVALMHWHNSERTVSFASDIPLGTSFSLFRVHQTYNEAFVGFSEQTPALALGYRQRGIWSVCCVAGGGDGQTISDEGTATEEKSFCVHSWAHMWVDLCSE